MKSDIQSSRSSSSKNAHNVKSFTADLATILQITAGEDKKPVFSVCAKPAGQSTVDNHNNSLEITASGLKVVTPLMNAVPGSVLCLDDSLFEKIDVEKALPNYVKNSKPFIRVSRSYQALVVDEREAGGEDNGSINGTKNLLEPLEPASTWQTLGSVKSHLHSKIDLLSYDDEKGCPMFFGIKKEECLTKELVKEILSEISGLSNQHDNSTGDSTVNIVAGKGDLEKTYNLKMMKESFANCSSSSSISSLLSSQVSEPASNQISREKQLLAALAKRNTPVIGNGQHRKRIRGMNGTFFVSDQVKIELFNFEEGSNLGANDKVVTLKILEPFPRLQSQLDNERTRYESGQAKKKRKLEEEGEGKEEEGNSDRKEIGSNFVNFRGLKFLTTKNTMAPKESSGCLVEAAVDIIKDKLRVLEMKTPKTSTETNTSEKNSTLHIVDLGTGTGCLLISAVTELRKELLISSSANIFSKIKAIGVDLCPEALAVAKKNAEILLNTDDKADTGLKDSSIPVEYEFVNASFDGPWANSLKLDQEKIDSAKNHDQIIFLCNPPYMSELDYKATLGTNDKDPKLLYFP